MGKSLPKGDKPAAESKNAPNLQLNTRFQSLMTYVTGDQLVRVLEEHRNDLSGCTYILHDRDVHLEDTDKNKKGDPKEAHYHVALVLVRARRLKDVIGWFKHCTDSKGEVANTMAQKITSLESLHDYFLHWDEESRRLGKFQYAETDLKVLVGIPQAWEFETPYDKTGGMTSAEKAEEENSRLIDDILGGESYREMARRYGRDYMKNHKAYREYCAHILLEENGGDLDEALRLMGDPIADEQKRREVMARNEGIAVGERDTLLSVIRYLDNEYKSGATYLDKTLEVLRHTLRFGGKL